MEKHEFFQLFINELRDIYDAERQIVESLPQMASASTSVKLKEAIQTHFAETRNQVKRLENIFNTLDEKPTGKTCEAMEGLIEECEECVHTYPATPTRDAAIIAALQRIEHYEIAVYGTLRTFAKQLDLDDIANILQESLNEEGNANKTLTSIAEGGFFTSGVNQKAMKS